MAASGLFSFLFVLSFLNVSTAQTVFKQAKPIEKISAFDHSRKEHRLECQSCHVRKDNKAVPSVPYHAACIDCHVSDFTSKTSQLCGTCHKLPLDAKVKTYSFPASLKEFGVKSFSHRDHTNPVKLKPEKTPQCNSCHAFDAKQIVAEFPSHPECYSCHVHQSKQKLGACNSCHGFAAESMKYQITLGDAYKLYNFTHGSHLKQPTVGVRCDKCHQLQTAQTPQQVDITVISTARGQRHKSLCWQCHDRRTESLCRKCHVTGPPLGSL
jgi:hypothetical protein